MRYSFYATIGLCKHFLTYNSRPLLSDSSELLYFFASFSVGMYNDTAQPSKKMAKTESETICRDCINRFLLRVNNDAFNE